jgi:hypothetical protein
MPVDGRKVTNKWVKKQILAGFLCYLRRIVYLCTQNRVVMRMNTGYGRAGEYEHYTVNDPMPLLEWLLQNLSQSKSKVKAILQGRGIKVDGKTVSQFDFTLERGMKVAVSKTQRK